MQCYLVAKCAGPLTQVILFSGHPLTLEVGATEATTATDMDQVLRGFAFLQHTKIDVTKIWWNIQTTENFPNLKFWSYLKDIVSSLQSTIKVFIFLHYNSAQKIDKNLEIHLPKYWLWTCFNLLLKRRQPYLDIDWEGKKRKKRTQKDEKRLQCILRPSERERTRDVLLKGKAIAHKSTSRYKGSLGIE